MTGESRAEQFHHSSDSIRTPPEYLNRPAHERGADAAGGDPERILALLADEKSRDVLTATAEQFLTVSEIANRCEMSIATAYRKVNDLHEEGLLSQSVQIRPHGKNVNRYTLRVETARVAFTVDDGLSASFSVGASGRE